MLEGQYSTYILPLNLLQTARINTTTSIRDFFTITASSDTAAALHTFCFSNEAKCA